jgi:hypothetical protein
LYKFLFSEYEPVFLIKRSKEEVAQQIAKLTDPVYLDVLEVLPQDDDDENGTHVISSDEDEEGKRKSKRRKNKKLKEERKKKKKSDPGSISQPEKGELKLPRSQFTELQSIVADCVKYGFENEAELARTQAILHINGEYALKEVEGDGNCLFRSILQQLDISSIDDYTVQDLRNQVVHFICSNPEAVFLSQAEQLRALYGGRQEEVEKKDMEVETPGPFSLKTYLEYMLEDQMWGDQIILMAISMMWNIRLSVLNTAGNYTLTFRHHKSLAESEMVLVFNGHNHYCAAG